MATLADPDVVTTRFLADDRDVESLLRAVAVADLRARAHRRRRAVTGMSNQSVARFLLDNGLAWAEGCVYLDEEDRQMVLMRVSEATSEEQEQEQEQSSETNKASSEEKDVRENARGRARAKKKYDALPLSRVAALDPSRRFTFYDQVHTTGMDIRQAPAARAAVTLGKDMTLRDYAQGAFRMRQIGRGQRLSLLVTPEVKRLVEARRRRARARRRGARRRRRAPGAGARRRGGTCLRGWW